MFICGLWIINKKEDESYEVLFSRYQHTPPQAITSSTYYLSKSSTTILSYICMQVPRITMQHAALRSITQHHAAPRSTTQHHAAPRSTTQHATVTSTLPQSRFTNTNCIILRRYTTVKTRVLLSGSNTNILTGIQH